ncbi:MAG: hypothetical protein IJS45_07530 [Clostridia bacterium]|nr:hypothetical protein [Clostridia bacterium]
MIGELPQSVCINGVDYPVRTDFRDILKILVAFSDPELEDKEKMYVLLFIFYETFDDIPDTDYEEASKEAIRFIDSGRYDGDDDARKSPVLMDWEQDESIIFPAINKVAGFETRSAEYVHWWTFMGYYMEIVDGVFSNVLSIRAKKAKGKKLEKWEKDFWSANKKLCVLKTKLTKEEQEEKNRLNALLGE